MFRFFLAFIITAVCINGFAADRALVLRQMKAEQRVALLIGNSDYQSNPLRNPVNDVRAMSSVLGSLGFDVLSVENASQREMDEAVSTFGRKLQGGGVGLFYYAGHGIQVGGQNYLIPVDAVIDVEGDVKYRSVNVGTVLSKMEAAGNRLNIVLLDACRNNPFARSWRSATEGLAKLDAPTGTFIAYATAPGSVASDGDGENGPFTMSLMSAMQHSGLTIENVMKRVRVEVAEKTGRKQIPWTSSSLMGDFYFRLPDEAGVDIPMVAMTKKPSEPVETKLPEYFTDELVNMEFMLVKGGCFMMGSTLQKESAPVHEVCVDDFYIGTYEVTNAQYDQYDSSHGSVFYKGKSMNSFAQPVSSVSWYDAVGFINWLNKRTKSNYRLPTEAEWEYAARGGTSTSRYWGENPDEACMYANGADQSAKAAWSHWTVHNCRDGYEVSAPVGSFRPNDYGLYDMLGNAWEWVEDTYSDTAYATHAKNNPRNLTEGKQKTYRGGAWIAMPSGVNAYARFGMDGSKKAVDLGFRIVKPVR